MQSESTRIYFRTLNYANLAPTLPLDILFKAAGDKLVVNKFIRQRDFGGGLTLKKTLYLEHLGADSVETLQRAWGMVEMQQGCF